MLQITMSTLSTMGRQVYKIVAINKISIRILLGSFSLLFLYYVCEKILEIKYFLSQ